LAINQPPSEHIDTISDHYTLDVDAVNLRRRLIAPYTDPGTIDGSFSLLDGKAAGAVFDAVRYIGSLN
jgi:hypothetical protein